MNDAVQVWLDALRSLTLAALVTWVGWRVGARLPARLGWRWLLLVAPLVTPALLVGYTYAPLALGLAGAPSARLAFYSALVALKFLPLAALSRRFLAPPISPEAKFCAQLAGTARSFALRGAGPMPWAVALLIFLLIFTDFELAARLSLKTWTVMLFAGHAGGLALSQAVARAALPLTLCLAAIFVLVLLLRKMPRASAREMHIGKTPRWVDATLLAAAVLLGLVPLVRIAGQACSALGTLGVQEVLGEDVLASLTVAIAATGGAWLLVQFSVSRMGRAFTLTVLLPGLLGALGLALVLLAVLHAPPLDWFPLRLRARWIRTFDFIARSPLPLVFAEVLLLAPVAFFLRQMLAAQQPGESLHLARMAGSRHLLWALALRPRAAALALLFSLAYAEFTAAAMLAPPGFTPVFVRLHLLTSHGQTATLSALLLAALLAPAAVLALTFAAARFYARRDVR
jgi:ABC-type Fe3+ transport system permease subunit